MSSVIQVTSWLSSAGGGIPPVIRALVAEFRRRQLDCLIAGLADPAGAPPIFPKDWPVLAGRLTGPAAFGYSAELARQLRPRACKDSVIHVHGLWMYPGWLARQCADRARAGRVVSPHGMLEPWALQNSRWKKSLAARVFENRNLHTAACLHALCESEARAIRAFGLINPIAVIPNGIDLPIIQNSANLKSETLKLESRNPPWAGVIEPGRKVLLFLSRIHPKKGLVNLLNAWAENRQSAIGNRQSEEWVLVIAGWDQGGHEAELKRRCTELGIAFADVREKYLQPSTFNLQPSVLFLGPQFNEDKAACYQNCDAFILPSFSEGLPMVVLEAWAFGKPVLMTPECNLLEGFAANAAIRIEPNVESIAQGLQELFRTPHSALRTLGDNGHILVAAQFTWLGIATKMKSVYDWLLGGGPRPDCLADF